MVGDREITETLSKESGQFRRDSNQDSPEYKSRTYRHMLSFYFWYFFHVQSPENFLNTAGLKLFIPVKWHPILSIRIKYKEGFFPMGRNIPYFRCAFQTL
jgi:hypothetical protein